MAECTSDMLRYLGANYLKSPCSRGFRGCHRGFKIGFGSCPLCAGYADACEVTTFIPDYLHKEQGFWIDISNAICCRSVGGERYTLSVFLWG